MSEAFGGYEILHELKAGGMGDILLACRRGPGTFAQVVAIKTIRAELAASTDARAMFLDEAATLARLDHPGVAHVHQFGEEGGALYMVMEYVPGVRFRELAELHAPPAVIAQALAAAARGLHAAHEARDLTGTPLGLVHRDISPDNLLLTYDGHVKVIDFGIALVKNRQAPVTEMGMLKGKPPYMSPEQLKNEAIDRRSDVFSLGVVGWELLAQQRLFVGDSLFAIALAVEQQPIPAPSARGAASSKALDAVVLRALERDPARRTATARDFAEALDRSITDADETLEAWAQRALAAPREAHARWLAALMAGTTGATASAGRRTGELTAVAVRADDAAPPPVEPPRVEPPRVESPRVEPRARRRRGAVIAVVGLAGLLAGGAAYLAQRAPAGAASAPPDARTELVAIVADAPPADASVADAAPQLAEVIDAPPPDTARKHVRRPTRELATRSPEPAPPIPSAPIGSGLVTIRYKPGRYANISIDSGAPMPGPIIKRKLAAGTHAITFLDPMSGDVLDKQDVVVADGEAVTVTQR